MTNPEQLTVKEAPLYLHYKIEIQNIPLEWDYTICDSLASVRKTLDYLDIYFDDTTIEAKVIITGIGMSRKAFRAWKKENLEQ